MFKDQQLYDAGFIVRETPLRSYFLGLFMADGWMSSNNRQAFIALNDKQIIDDLGSFMYRDRSCLKLDRKYDAWNSYESKYLEGDRRWPPWLPKEKNQPRPWTPLTPRPNSDTIRG